jgi:hypothetical protein
MSEKTETTFEKLISIDISKNVEKRKSGSAELSYLSWASAWEKLKRNFPDSSYKVKEYEGKPYLFDENLGYLVTTEVTVNCETISMSLPVMDGANRAQKHITYKQWGKDVLPATMFDINKSIMRCLAKNIAMFGLGITLYLGEDLPASQEINQEIEKVKQEEQAKKVEEFKEKLENAANEIIGKLEKENIDKAQKWFDLNVKNLNAETVEKYIQKRELIKEIDPKN